jgi:hypothetical protein
MKLGLGEKKAQKRDSHLKTATKREPYEAEKFKNNNLPINKKSASSN